MVGKNYTRLTISVVVNVVFQITPIQKDKNYRKKPISILSSKLNTASILRNLKDIIKFPSQSNFISFREMTR